MNGKALAAVLLAATMSGAVGMSGCAARPDPATSASTSTSGRATPASSPAASDAHTTALLALHEKLRTQLGDAYSDSWIEDNQLHLAVTTDAGVKMVREAGAMATLVTVNAAQLAAAAGALAAWRATLPAEQGAAIHKISTDGRTGTVTIFVAAAQLDAVAKAVSADHPAGEIAVVIRESAGLPTPLQSLG